MNPAAPSPTAGLKIALVTGANRGIGLEVARQLGRRGHVVLLGARDAARGEAAANGLRADGIHADVLTLDTTSEASVFSAAAEAARRLERIDVVVNNAGINFEFAQAAHAPSQLPLDVLRATYETNVFGTFLVIRHFLPLLRKSEAARIVNVSSSLGSLARQATPGSPGYGATTLAYNSSKAAVNAITIQFANELDAAGIKVNSVDPGLVATDMTAPKADPLRNPTADEASGLAPKTVQQGAEVIVRLATLDAHGPTGGFFDEDGVVPW